MASGRDKLTIATRQSQLALIQTKHVQSTIQSHREFAHVEIKLFEMSTLGDQVLDKPLSKVAVGDKGLFTSELEDAIRRKDCDFAVHSLKDLPTNLPPGLVVGAISERENPNDAFVAHPSLLAAATAGAAGAATVTLASLPKGSVIGTSSLRRAAQIRNLYPHLLLTDVRGNLNTRLRKLDESNPSPIPDGAAAADISSGHFAGLVLAVSGLERLGMKHRITQDLGDVLLHAVGQGALAVECRDDDFFLIDNMLAKTVHNKQADAACRAERAFLRTLEGGCQVPIGVRTRVDLQANTVVLEGAIFSISGATCFRDTHTGTVRDCEKVGKELAEKLVAAGAQTVLDEIIASKRKK